MKILLLLDKLVYDDKRATNELQLLQELAIETIVIHRLEAGKKEQEMFMNFPLHRLFDTKLNQIKEFKARKKYVEELIQKFDFNVVWAHNEMQYHIAKEIKKRKPNIVLIYESRELFHAWPINYSSYSDTLLKVKTWLVRKYEVYREAKDNYLMDYLLTVCDSLAEVLVPYFNVKTKPIVIRNIPSRIHAIVKSNYLREKFNIPQENKILIFSGANVYPKTRNVEPVMDEIGNQPNKSLVILANNNVHRKAVEDYATANQYNNIYFHDTVAMTELYSIIASADVGLVPTWNKKDLSYWYALDNKLFDYVLAQIPILATVQPEYQKIISQYQIGICINPDEKNAYLNGFDQVLANNYSEPLKAALEILNWDQEKLKLKDFLSSLRSQTK